MKVLVTGGGGFLGRAICRQLVSRGDRPIAFGRGEYPDLAAAGIETRRGDVRDADAVARACGQVDAVIHSAGLAGIWGPWNEYYGINVQGTRNVIDGCLQAGLRQLVYTSSPSVTFDGRDQCGVDESAPYPRRWLCHYAQTKALAEQDVRAAHGRGGLRTCALRPHLIWGPGDTQLFPRLVARARSGQLRRVGSGTNLIDTIYVDNAADAHLAALDRLQECSPVGGQAYFLSQGQPVNCWLWVDRLLEIADQPPVARRISLAAAWTAGAVLERLWSLLRLRGEPRLTRFLAAQLGRSHYYNIARARRDLGYEPHIDEEEGLRRLAAWWAAEKSTEPKALATGVNRTATPNRTRPRP